MRKDTKLHYLPCRAETYDKLVSIEIGICNATKVHIKFLNELAPPLPIHELQL